MKPKKPTKKRAMGSARSGASAAVSQATSGTTAASPDAAEDDITVIGVGAKMSSTGMMGTLAEEDAEFHLAFERVESEIRAVDPSRLLVVNVDLRTVVTTIVGAYPEIFALRPIIATLGTVDVTCVDKLLDHALALGHAHTLYMLATQSRDELAAFASEGIAVRDLLRADAVTLAKRSLINPDLIERLQNGISYRAIAFDLVAISLTLLEAWPRLQGKVAFEYADLTAARTLGNRMVKLVGQREQAPVAREKAAIVRQQAFTLCADTYEEVRFAVHFARRYHGDGESIAPSLFQARGRRGGDAEVPGADSQLAELSAEAPEPLGHTNTTRDAESVFAPTPATSTVPVGHPGSPAFKR
jgi:hypothetical protein